MKKLNYKVTDTPKKNPKKDLRRYSSIFFWLGLAGINAVVYFAFIHKTFTYTYANSNGNGNAVVVTQDPNDVDGDDDAVKILSIDPEQIENIVNTEAFTHAAWPGYRGDINNGVAVRRHFSEQLAKYIINAGGVEVNVTKKVHFYYVVRDDGNIQFLSLVSGGRTSDNTPRYLIEHAQSLVNIGVPGIKPGTDVNGDPITVIYELVIVFKPAF